MSFVIEFLHLRVNTSRSGYLNSVTTVLQVCFLVSHFSISFHILNRYASLYFSTTTTIANEFWFSVIVYCLSSAPAISGCKTNLHFQNSTYILCYIDLSFLFSSTTPRLSNHWEIDLLCLTFRKLNDLFYCLLSSVFIWIHAQWTISLV